MKQRPKYRVDELQNDIEKESKNHDETEMSTKTFNEIRTIEIELKDGDTLQALSIRYRCPIAEIKRLNTLHRDNEIFARRSIKIPYRYFSMAAVHKSGENSPDTNFTKKSVDASILKQKLSSVSSLTYDEVSNGKIVDNLIDIGDGSKNENNFNQIIFNITIVHSDQIESEEDISDEEVHLIPNLEQTEQISNDFSCSGADWGLSWPFLLAIILIVAFAGPLIYIFYITEHPEKYHHHS